MHRIITITILLFVAVSIAACGGEATAIALPTKNATQPTPPAATDSGPASGHASLADSLSAAGATVELAGQISQPFFSVPGQIIKVNGADVQVFEYDNRVAAKEEASLVSPDGDSVGNSAISWMATPHFYEAGRLIVLYVGDDSAIVGLLESAVGQQFAGGKPEAGSPAIDSCPSAAAETRLLTNEAHGYCLLYPIEYKVEKPSESETVLVIGSLLNVQDPRLSIVVEQASGRTAATVADQVVADLQGFDIERRSVSLGGVEAIVLDNLPGQEINRQVIVEHSDLLYQLTFTPADENLGDAYARMEALYDLIVSSFAFIRTSAEVQSGQDCMDAKADEQSLIYEPYNFCVLSPIGYDVNESTANQLVLYVGSLLDVEHPKAFIEVGDAARRTAEQVADELAAEVEASIPGYQVERTFGWTVGYEPAWVLENMPGQDISRQVVVVHDGRLYKLTFVPADASAGEVYAQMEDLFTTVVNSLRFLR